KLAQRMTLMLRRSTKAALPLTVAGDRLYHWLRFINVHKRLPLGRKMLLNDVLYRLMTGPEIDKDLRRYVTDKEFVKSYIREKIGDQFNVPTLAVLRTVEEALRF